jgi:hypothetical protein
VSDSGDGFLSRWSRRKTALREGQPLADAPAVQTQTPVASPVRAELAEAPGEAVRSASPQPRDGDKPPPPTLDDVAKLVAGDDIKRFVAPDVEPAVKNAALKKLFAEPHFNVMDGLDTYIDDYGKPDPIPESMLRQMVQSKILGLFADEPDEPAKTATTNDPDPAVRLQPDDAAGPAGPAQGTEPDPRRDA